MKRWLAILALVLPAWLVMPTSASAADVTMAARQSVTLDFPGVIAVFAVDASTVETAMHAGQVFLLGRRAGDTVVTIVLARGVETLQVHVDPPAPLPAMLEAARDKNRGMWEGRYDTGLHRFSTSLTANFGQGEQTGRLRVEALHQQETLGQRQFSALPFASLELQSPGRSVVFLDQFVRATPLTMDGVAVRGFHLREGELEVHAGLASISPTDDLLVPRNADRAASVAWHMQRGDLRVVPSVMWLPDSKASVPGAVSVAVEGGQEADPLHYRAEIGYSGQPGASFDIDYRRGETQGWMRGVYRPSGFAAPRAGRPAGTSLEGAWSQRVTESTLLNVTGSATRVEVGDAKPIGASGSVDVRQDLADHWSATAALSGGTYRGANGVKVTRGTVSGGAAYEGTNFGASALLRHQETSLAEKGGNGARFTLRASEGGWRANAFVDAQEQATTLDLVLQGDPEIRRAMTELGIAATNPEDVVRQLRDNAGLLASRGVVIGELRTNPLRVQSGVNVSWRGESESRPELGLRVIDDRAQGVIGARRAFVASLYANWRLTPAIDVGVSYSRWTYRQGTIESDANSSFQFLARTRFDTLPVPGEGGRAIVGQVMRTDTADSAPVPAAGIDVVLDRSRRTRTDAQGRFTFEGPGAGAHRVDAILPPQPGVFFTTPSTLTVQPGGDANFTMNFSGARLSGIVRDDAGQPIAGVTVRIEGPVTATAITDSSGTYRLGSPPGEARIYVVAETLPPGYEVANLPPRARVLAHSTPAVVNFAVRAQRSVEGVAMCGSVPASLVRAPEISREAVPDATGRFVLRRLPAGVLNLQAQCPDGPIGKTIDVPAEPGILRGQKLGMRAAATNPT
ncbi:MAG: carboxypeptidase-like regulatory domain-containing protein [Pseudomonadota bacterium]